MMQSKTTRRNTVDKDICTLCNDFILGTAYKKDGQLYHLQCAHIVEFIENTPIETLTSIKNKKGDLK